MSIEEVEDLLPECDEEALLPAELQTPLVVEKETNAGKDPTRGQLCLRFAAVADEVHTDLLTQLGEDDKKRRKKEGAGGSSNGKGAGEGKGEGKGELDATLADEDIEWVKTCRAFKTLTSFVSTVFRGVDPAEYARRCRSYEGTKWLAKIAVDTPVLARASFFFSISEYR